MKTKFYYSMENGGDGSAYPKFFLDKETAEAHQDLELEWGEPCTGYIELESDGPISFSRAQTREHLITDLEEQIAMDEKYPSSDEYNKLPKLRKVILQRLKTI